MRRQIIAPVSILVCVCAALGALSMERVEARSTASGSELPTMRVGWQANWATQGQMVEALKHTDIAADNGLQLSFTAFHDAPPLVEAALQGRLDVASGGSLPMLDLVARSDEWVIVARNANTRLAILVPANSKIKTARDLKGKSIAVPHGTSTHRFVLETMEKAGVSRDEYTIPNRIDAKIVETARKGSSHGWGVDAVAVWEPSATILESEGHARVIAETVDTTLTAMSRKYIHDYPDEAVAFMRSYREAWAYYAQNHEEMDTAFLRDTRLPVDRQILETVARTEPNAFVQSVEEVDVALDAEDIAFLQSVIGFSVSNDLLPGKIDTDKVIDQSFLERAKGN